MPAPADIILTRLLRIRLKQRGISENEVRFAIAKPLKREIQSDRGEHGGNVYKYKNDEHVVVAEVKGKTCWIITAYENEQN